MTSIADLRKSYERAELDESASLADPLAQFRLWLDQALAGSLPEPNAMTLATGGADGGQGHCVRLGQLRFQRLLEPGVELAQRVLGGLRLVEFVALVALAQGGDRCIHLVQYAARPPACMMGRGTRCARRGAVPYVERLR
jgi:hypothetical protein